MRLTVRHRRVARLVWECGGQVEEAAARAGVQPDTLRRWLTCPAFRSLIAQSAYEPIVQAASAVLRWAPVAVARLIRDLQSESGADARQAAREVLRLALDTQRELADAGGRRGGEAGPETLAAGSDDPLTRRVSRLTDAQLARVLAILNEPANGEPA